MIKEDDQRRPRIKIYRDRESGMPKGDGLVTYLKDPSVSTKAPAKSDASSPSGVDLCKHARAHTVRLIELSDHAVLSSSRPVLDRQSMEPFRRHVFL